MLYNLKTWEFFEEEYPNQYIEDIWVKYLHIDNENYCDNLSLEDCIEYEKLVKASNEMKEARELYFLINNYNISRSWYNYFIGILQTNYIK